MTFSIFIRRSATNQCPIVVNSNTGVSLEWERLLSSAFVRAADYGTRCSTVVRIDESRRACFDEWSWDAAGEQTGAVNLQFELE